MTTDSTSPKTQTARPVRKKHVSHGARIVALAASVSATGGLGAAMAAADHAATHEFDTIEVAASAGLSAAPATVMSQSSSTTGAASTTRNSTTTTPATPPAAASGYADGTYTGTAQYTKWGNVQVQVTIKGGAIVDVATLQIPSDNKSATINNRATPALETQAIATQSADLDIVSGATYTSRTYAASLQAALDLAAQGSVKA